MNSLVTTASSHALEATNRAKLFAEFAQEPQKIDGKLLKFAKGSYEHAGVAIPIDRQFVAHVSQVMHGFVKFGELGEKPEYRIGKVEDGFRMPDRDTLDCLDQSQWRIGPDGKPRDPWTPQVYLPVTAVNDASEAYSFVSASAGGFSAVKALSRAYFGHGADALPVIELSSETYRHKKFGKIVKPHFKIVRWLDEAPDHPFDVEYDGPEIDATEIPF